MAFAEDASRWYAEMSENLGPFGARARKVTVGIVHSTTAGASLIGSGVLVRIGHERFVFTAAHVIEAEEFSAGTGAQLLGPNGTSHAVVAGTFTLPRDGASRAADPIDAAVLRMKPECLDPPGCEYLTLADLHVRIGPEESVCLFAYPERYASYDGPTRNIRMDPLPYMSFTIPEDLRVRSSFDATMNIAFALDRRQAVRLPGTLQDLPKLNGMSGGGLWHLRPDDGAAMSATARLVGIFTEHRRGQKLGVATNVGVHLQLLCDYWPELEPLVRLELE